MVACMRACARRHTRTCALFAIIRLRALQRGGKNARARAGVQFALMVGRVGKIVLKLHINGSLCGNGIRFARRLNSLACDVHFSVSVRRHSLAGWLALGDIPLRESTGSVAVRAMELRARWRRSDLAMHSEIGQRCARQLRTTRPQTAIARTHTHKKMESPILN